MKPANREPEAGISAVKSLDGQRLPTFMWNLDDSARFVRVVFLEVPWAHTWADTRPGRTDRERRERLRRAAAGQVQPIPQSVSWWAFRISVRKTGRRPFDIENVAKPIIDAFCARQIKRDRSEFHQVALYSDDSIDSVRFIQLFGERGRAQDSTIIEVFAFVG